MILKIIFYLLFYLYSINLYSANIRVVDLQELVDSNKEIINLIKNIEDDQISHRKEFAKIESFFESELQRIEGLKLILEKSELENVINKYNEDLHEFNEKVAKFNIHYENQINTLKKKILEKILEILQKYSLENKIDLILDSNNYILSSNSINITNLILEDLNKINFETNFEKFK